MKNFQERMRSIKLNIAYYRKLRGLTQERFSEILHISRPHLSTLESPNSSNLITLELLFEISDALGIDVAQLLEIRK